MAVAQVSPLGRAERLLADNTVPLPLAPTAQQPEAEVLRPGTAISPGEPWPVLVTFLERRWRARG